MTIRYYIDTDGAYVGGFEGEHGIDVSMYIEVPSAPEDAAYHWIGTEWLSEADYDALFSSGDLILEGGAAASVYDSLDQVQDGGGA